MNDMKNYTPQQAEVRLLYVYACMKLNPEGSASEYRKEFDRFLGTVNDPPKVVGPWTSHGHEIPGLSIEFPASEVPTSRARCGGPLICSKCQADTASAYVRYRKEYS